MNNRLFVRTFASTRALKGAPIPRFGLTAKKAPKGPRPKVKGVPGASKDFYEYVNSKPLAEKAPRISELPVVHEEFSKLLQQDSVPPVLAKYDGEVLKKLHYLGGVFKKGQFNELFYEKVTLLRDEALTIAKGLATKLGEKYIVTGEAGVGKSTVLNQVQAYLLSQPDLLVLNIPNLKRTLDGSYLFAFNKALGLYETPLLLKKIMVKFAKLNKDRLEKIPILAAYTFGNARFSPENTNLYTLCTFPAKIPVTYYATVFEEITKTLKSQTNYKLYLTIDDFNLLGLSPYTAYKNPEFESIPYSEFQLHKYLLGALEGLQNYLGAVLATSSLFKNTSSLLVPLKQSKLSPFDKEYSNVLEKPLAGARVVNVDTLSKDQVQSFVRWHVNNGLIIDQDKQVKDEELDLEAISNQKYFLSSGGNPRELIKACNLLYY